jgi:hypothetical protein
MTLILALAVLLWIALLVVAGWPWVDPYLLRRDAYTRLLDRLDDEWAREVDDTDGPTMRNGMGW